eukprot:c19515_g1_i1 orf=356-712(+)
MTAPYVANLQVDWVETADSHMFQVDVPGLRKENIQLKVLDGDILQISGNRISELVEGKWHRLERPRGSFIGQFKLRDRVRAHKIRAEYENGVLSLVVPKRAAPPTTDSFNWPRRISYY